MQRMSECDWQNMFNGAIRMRASSKVAWVGIVIIIGFIIGEVYRGELDTFEWAIIYMATYIIFAFAIIRYFESTGEEA